MAYDAKAVANYFLDLAAESNETLTPMKLQKLVFFAHGWHLAIYGTALLDEQVEAWAFGPVVPTLYHEFKHVGNQIIVDKASTGLFRNGKFAIDVPSIPENETRATELLKRVWEVYSKYSAIQLSNMTHAPGTPWERVIREHGGRVPKSTDIPEQYIVDYFRQLASRK